MKIAPIFGILGFLGITFARPLETQDDKELKAAQIYVLGNLYNAAVSEEFSKTQAASDRNESEWNSTEMMNKVTHDQYGDEEVDRARDDQTMDDARVLIYAGGDASNVAIAYQASEAQASENDQKSGYNTQSLGLTTDSIAAEYADEDYEEPKPYTNPKRP